MYSTIPNSQYQSEKFLFKKQYGVKRNRTSFFAMMRSTIHSNSKGKEKYDNSYQKMKEMDYPREIHLSQNGKNIRYLIHYFNLVC